MEDKYLGGGAFMDGLKVPFKYGGDNKNLYIYYKRRTDCKVHLFRPTT